MGVVQLVDHLEATHHRLWAEFPRLAALINKIVEVYGERHSDLFDVAHRFDVLRADLEPHLANEEAVVFPTIRQLVTAGAAPSVQRKGPKSLISNLRAEPDRIGELSRRFES